MDTHEALQTRRTAHAWTTAAVPEAVIQRALGAAHMAPCHRMTWPWRFTLPGPTTREALVTLGLTLAARKRGCQQLSAPAQQRVRAKLGNPALVVVSQVRVEDAFRSKEDYAACACAIQNLSLSVHADGFHSKWSTGGLTRHPETYQHLQINEAEEEIIGFIWIGEPQKAPPTPTRRPLDEVVRRVP